MTCGFFGALHPGFYLILRYGDGLERDAVGFIVKLWRDRFYSERNGLWRHEWRVGPLYIRTYARRRK